MIAALFLEPTSLITSSGVFNSGYYHLNITNPSPDTPNPPPPPGTIASANLKPSTADTKKYNLSFQTASSTSFYQGTRQDGQNQKKAEGKYVLLLDPQTGKMVIHQLDTEFDMTFIRSEAASPAVKPAAQPAQAATGREKVGGKSVPRSIPTMRESSPAQEMRKPAKKSLPKKRPASDEEEDEDSDPGFTIEYPGPKPPPKRPNYGLGLGLSNSPLSMAHLSSAGRVAGKSPLGYAGKSPAGYAGKSPAGTYSARAGKSPAGFAGKSPAGYAGKSPANYAGKSPAMYGQKRSPPTEYTPQSPKHDNHEDSEEEEEMEDVDMSHNQSHHDEDEESEEDGDHNPDVDPLLLDPGTPKGAGNARHDSDSEEDLETLMERELLKGVGGDNGDSSESEEE